MPYSESRQFDTPISPEPSGLLNRSPRANLFRGKFRMGYKLSELFRGKIRIGYNAFCVAFFSEFHSARSENRYFIRTHNAGTQCHTNCTYCNKVFKS